jgi:hypothetical protein
MGKGKRTNGKSSARDLEIYQRAVQKRERYDDIAGDHSLTRGRIAQIVREVTTALVPDFIDQINQMRVQHTESLDSMVVEAMESWQKSTESDAGPDPRFLEVARKCLADQRRIWGAEAETILRAPTVPEEKPPPAIVMVVIETYEEYQEYLRVIEFKEVDDLILDVQSRRIAAASDERESA